MEAGLETTLTFLAVVVALALVVQTVILLVFVVAFRRWCQRTEALMQEVSRNVEPVLRTARDLLVDGKEKLQVISTSVAEITQLTKNQITRVDGIITDASDRARLQLIRVDQLVSDSLRRVEETTEAVQRSILGPVREISALLAGARSAVDFLLRRNKAGARHATQDEELFI